jgi:hypothetical protein
MLVFSASIPKDGEIVSEDYGLAQETESVFRAAVADGATNSFLSGYWAELLCQHYCQSGKDSVRSLSDLNALRATWRQYAISQPLPWYMQEKLKAGAAAAFVGITLYPSDERWEAVAIGDCCLFQLRDKQLLTTFPVERSEDFGAIPILLHTDPAHRGEIYTRATEGTFQAGDTFYLMSDALAAWFLRECEHGREPWNWLTDLKGNDGIPEFTRRICSLRESGRLKNDDTTLVHLRYPSPRGRGGVEEPG